MQKQVHPIHFEDFSGQQFERLCFAYILRNLEYTKVDWYGQLGADHGRDIICTHQNGSTHIYQCANYKKLTSQKIKEDFSKLAKGSFSKNAIFTLITGGGVSGKMKDSIDSLARKIGFIYCHVWSGIEFEERLRRDTPDLLLRFVDGVEFPENLKELKAFTANASSLTDEEIIKTLSTAFDRPAYKTPFHVESSLPRFRTAIIETIATLNTGSTSLGKVFPSKNDIKDPAKRKSIDELVEYLVALRASFESLLREGEIKHCSCGQEDCPTYMLTSKAIREMDEKRMNLLVAIQKLNPEFSASFYKI